MMQAKRCPAKPGHCALPLSRIVPEGQARDWVPSILQKGSTDSCIDIDVRMLLSKAAVTAAAVSMMVAPLPALAVLNSPRVPVARSADVALRRSIPAFNDDVATIQSKLESIQFKLRIPQRKPWSAMSQDVEEARKLAENEDMMLMAVPKEKEDQGRILINEIERDLARLKNAVELKDPDRTSIRTANALERIARLELLQAPGLPFPIPQQYTVLPRLEGRGVVEMTIEKADKSLAFVPVDSEEGPSRIAKLSLVVDGFSAPITAGNFMRNVIDGRYDGLKLSVSRESILAGRQGSGVGSIPLEIRPIGEFEPIYRTRLDVLSGELPVLPLSIQGAVAMAHLPGVEDNVGYVSAEQFFIHKFDRSSSGLAGLAYDEGDFGVFGFVITGTELLNTIEDGDILVSAQVLEGAEKLILPPPT